MPRSVEIQERNDGATSIHILSLNCWGLKFISKYRTERLLEIGKQIAAYSPPLDIVGLQECWTYADYTTIREITQKVLPYGKFYHSGIFGGGLVILSKFPIEDSSMFRYPLNGRPTAFFRGDWFVGKGVACATLRMPDGQAIDVFNTHLHAPYEREPNDSYICHRTAQAWEIAKLMRGAAERGSLVIGLGDFNMVPMSFAHVLIESRGLVRDVWRVKKPQSSIGASIDVAECDRRQRLGLSAAPDLDESLNEHGHTCDSISNTWRWNEAHRKALEKGQDRKISGTELDPKAKRLDYIFFGARDASWQVEDVKVALTDRHPTLRCSLSDHFAVDAVITRSGVTKEASIPIRIAGTLRSNDRRASHSDVVRTGTEDFDKFTSEAQTHANLQPSFYEDILQMIHTYILRERKQRRWRMTHFLVSTVVSIGCFIAVWWSPRNFVAFILILVSSLGIMAGTLDGLIGGLFVGSELRALAEFEWEVRNAYRIAGGPERVESNLRDWYD